MYKKSEHRRGMASFLQFFFPSDFHTEVRRSDALSRIDTDNALCKITCDHHSFRQQAMLSLIFTGSSFLKKPKLGHLITFMWAGTAGKFKTDKIITYRQIVGQ
jgi:hypothetical protein